VRIEDDEQPDGRSSAATPRVSLCITGEFFDRDSRAGWPPIITNFFRQSSCPLP
jgi:hypothetical protein